jgi:hypothetical protein
MSDLVIRKTARHDWMGRNLAFATLIPPVLLFFSIGVQAQSTSHWPEDKPLASATISCGSQSPAKSGVIKSPSANNASVEMQATVTQTSKGKHCETTWLLHVGGPQRSPKTIEVDSRADESADNDYGYENSFELIGWSQDGMLLLGSTVIAAGDFDETSPVVYDYSKDKWWKVSLTPLFQKLTAANCLLLFRPTGFTTDGKVLVFVGDPATDYGNKPCIAAGRWVLDYEKKTITKFNPSSKASESKNVRH